MSALAMPTQQNCPIEIQPWAEFLDYYRIQICKMFAKKQLAFTPMIFPTTLITQMIRDNPDLPQQKIFIKIMQEHGTKNSDLHSTNSVLDLSCFKILRIDSFENKEKGETTLVFGLEIKSN